MSDLVAGIIKIEDHPYGFEIESLLDIMTFQAVEKAIAQGLRNRVIKGSDGIQPDDVKAVATRRQAGHWASLHHFLHEPGL